MNQVPTEAQVLFVRSVVSDFPNVTDPMELTRRYFVTRSPALHKMITQAYLSVRTRELMTRIEVTELSEFCDRDNLDRVLLFIEHCNIIEDISIVVTRRAVRIVYDSRLDYYTRHHSADGRKQVLFEGAFPNDIVELSAMLNKVTSALWRKQVTKYLIAIDNEIEMGVHFSIFQHETRSDSNVYNGTIIRYRTRLDFTFLCIMYTPIANYDAYAYPTIPLLHVPIIVYTKTGRPMVMGVPIHLFKKDILLETSRFPFDCSEANYNRLKRSFPVEERGMFTWVSNLAVTRDRRSQMVFGNLGKRDEEIHDVIHKVTTAFPLTVSGQEQHAQQAPPATQNIPEGPGTSVPSIAPPPGLYGSFTVPQPLVHGDPQAILPPPGLSAPPGMLPPPGLPVGHRILPPPGLSGPYPLPAARGLGPRKEGDGGDEGNASAQHPMEGTPLHLPCGTLMYADELDPPQDPMNQMHLQALASEMPRFADDPNTYEYQRQMQLIHGDFPQDASYSTEPSFYADQTSAQPESVTYDEMFPALSPTGPSTSTSRPVASCRTYASSVKKAIRKAVAPARAFARKTTIVLKPAPPMSAPRKVETPILRSAPWQVETPILRSAPRSVETPILRSTPLSVETPILRSAPRSVETPILRSAPRDATPRWTPAVAETPAIVLTPAAEPARVEKPMPAAKPVLAAKPTPPVKPMPAPKPPTGASMYAGLVSPTVPGRVHRPKPEVQLLGIPEWKSPRVRSRASPEPIAQQGPAGAPAATTAKSTAPSSSSANATRPTASPKPGTESAAPQKLNAPAPRASSDSMVATRSPSSSSSAVAEPTSSPDRESQQFGDESSAFEGDVPPAARLSASGKRRRRKANAKAAAANAAAALALPSSDSDVFVTPSESPREEKKEEQAQSEESSAVEEAQGGQEHVAEPPVAEHPVAESPVAELPAPEPPVAEPPVSGPPAAGAPAVRLPRNRLFARGVMLIAVYCFYWYAMNARGADPEQEELAHEMASELD